MKKDHGFSIIELLVVISVISILIGVVLPRFKGMQDEANKAKAKAELKTLQVALESWYTNHIPHVYPDATENICDDYLNLDSTRPMIIEEILYDPFGAPEQEYTYYVNAPDYTYYAVVSAGPDRIVDIEGIDENGLLIGDGDDDIYVTNGEGF